jgi:fatty acid desaturase
MRADDGGDRGAARRRRRAQRAPDATDLTNQPALQRGGARRWLIPATLLAAVVVVLLAFALQLQPVLPVVGIVLAVVLWVAMLVVAGAVHDARRRNRVLAALMIAMAAGSLAIVMVLYATESAAG